MKKIILLVMICLLCASKVAANEEISGKYASGKIYYHYVISNNEATIVNFEGEINSGLYKIPSTITLSGTNYPVTKIGPGAFHYINFNLNMSIEIPDTVKIIDDYAFNKSSSIISVKIPNSVTSIGNYAFENCSLTNISIPESVTYIGSSAFKGTKLTNITISKNVTSIGQAAFSHCSNLTTISVDNENTVYTSVDGILFTKNRTELLACPGAIRKYIIPDSVTTIGNYAFYGCSNLTNITIPNSVSSVGSYAFSATKLTNIIIPDSVTSLGNSAFSYCSNLTKITISKNVTNIDYDTFDGCSSLTNITVPDSVTNIDPHAFDNCTGLINITVDDNNKSYTSINGVLFTKDKTELLYFPGGKSGEYTIPDSVTSIHQNAFKTCNLTGISVNEKNQFYSSLDGVLFTKDKTELLRFPVYKKGKYIIPESVTTINSIAFNDCKNLTSIVIPNSITKIFTHTFMNCSNLTEITFHNSIKIIYSWAFSYCDKLKTVYFNGDEAAWNMIEYNDLPSNIEKKFFFYVDIIGKNGEIISKDTYDINTTITVPQKTGYNTKLYTNTECTEEFDILTPITSNLTLQLRYEPIETKTYLSQDEKTFTFVPCNIKNGAAIILGLYNGKEFIESQVKYCKNEDITFTTDKTYTKAKVFIWNTNPLSPICDVEIVK